MSHAHYYRSVPSNELWTEGSIYGSEEFKRKKLLPIARKFLKVKDLVSVQLVDGEGNNIIRYAIITKILKGRMFGKVTKWYFRYKYEISGYTNRCKECNFDLCDYCYNPKLHQHKLERIHVSDLQSNGYKWFDCDGKCFPVGDGTFVSFKPTAITMIANSTKNGRKINKKYQK
jgi:hypothetical protein